MYNWTITGKAAHLDQLNRDMSQLRPVPVPPISPVTPTFENCLATLEPLNDLEALALHVAQLTAIVADLHRRMSDDNGRHNRS